MSGVELSTSIHQHVSRLAWGFARMARAKCTSHSNLLPLALTLTIKMHVHYNDTQIIR